MYLKNQTANRIDLIFHVHESSNAIKDTFDDYEEFPEKSMENTTTSKCHVSSFGLLVKSKND